MRRPIKKPKKNKSLIKTSGAGDILLQYGPVAKDILQAIGDYGPPAAAAGSAAMLAGIRRKLKKIDEKYGGGK